MSTEERIQALALEWKETESDGTLFELRDTLITYLRQAPMLRFHNISDDEEQELNLLLFVDREKDGQPVPCQLKRSLRKYKPDVEGRTGRTVPFLSFFKQMVARRIQDVQRKRDNYTPRDPGRRRVTERPKVILTDEIPGETVEPAVSLDDEVLREILSKQIRDLFFRAVDRITNEKYRQPYLFSFFFADHFKRDELAALFDIAPGSINSNMKRAAELVTKHFSELLHEQEDISLEDLHHMLRRLNSTVMHLFISESDADPETMAVIRARFIDKLSPETIISELDISRETLLETEQLVVRAFFNTLERVRALRSVTPESGGLTMEFYESFITYLADPPAGDRTRGDVPLDRDAFLCHEILKMAIPTTRHAEQATIRKIVGGLDLAGIRSICEATALTPPQISAAIDDPDAFATQYRMLADHLTGRERQ